MVPSRKT
jgi:hypothetical protein